VSWGFFFEVGVGVGVSAGFERVDGWMDVDWLLGCLEK